MDGIKVWNNVRKGLESWPEFIEVTERRNLFVHAGGVVSSQYIKVCKDNEVDLGDISIGKEIRVSRKYFENAFNVIYEIGFKLTHVLWRKFCPDQLSLADSNLIELGYETLCEENYTLTKVIFDFADSDTQKT